MLEVVEEVIIIFFRIFSSICICASDLSPVAKVGIGMKIRAKNLNFVKHKMQLFLLMGIISKDICRCNDLTVKAVLQQKIHATKF